MDIAITEYHTNLIKQFSQQPDDVPFFYSDDLNAKTTEIETHNRLQRSNTTVYPPNALVSWNQPHLSKRSSAAEELRSHYSTHVATTSQTHEQTLVKISIPSISWSTKRDLLSVNPQPPILQYPARHPELTQGKLIGGGSSKVPQTNSTPKYPYLYPTHIFGNTGPLCIARNSRVGPLPWKPRPLLPLHHSDHIIDQALTDTLLERIKHSCQQKEDQILVFSKKNNRIHITSTQLRNILENGKSINDEVIHLFLETFSTMVNLPFLSPQFFSLLVRNGWEQARRSFSPHRYHPLRSIYKPGLRGESGIAIPCFINGCHWVGLVRREINNKVIFLFSDDLNDKSTEINVRNMMQQTDKNFYLDDAVWINCRSITYQPHYNECGPRTLLALTTMMQHPEPDENILLPFMHPNLSQILRTWVGGAILSGEVFLPDQEFTKTYIASNLLENSDPAYLINWLSNQHSTTTAPLAAIDLTTSSDPTIPLTRQTSTDKPSLHEYKMDTETVSPILTLVKPTPALQSTTGNMDSPPQLSPLLLKLVNDQNQGPRSTEPSLPSFNVHNVHNPYKEKQPLSLHYQNRQSATSPLHQFIAKVDSSHQRHVTATQSTITLASLQGLPNIIISKRETQPVNPKGRNYTPRKRKTTLSYHGFSIAPKYTQTDEIWGHSPEEIDTSPIFRVLLQNPNGLKFSEGDDLARFNLIEARNLGVGALCLPETNTNWTLLSSIAQLGRITRPIWNNSSTQTSQINDGFDGIYQPGGTLTMICENWASRIIEKGSDPFGLGRWSYFVLQRKGDVRIAIITAYQVCTAAISSLGPTTYAMQQYRKLSSTYRSDNRTDQPNPRRQFILDLQAWIEHLLRNKHDIILSMDGNEDYTQTPRGFVPLSYTPGKHVISTTHDGSLSTLLNTCGLTDTLTTHHTMEPPPPTYSRGSKRIDYIFISQALQHSTIRSGILPYNYPFISNHHPCFIDFDGALLFQDPTHSIDPPKRRGLQLSDPRKVSQYKEALYKQIDYHKIIPKKTILQTEARSGSWTE